MKKVQNKQHTRDALDILDRRHPPIGTDLEVRAAFSEAVEVAEMICQIREEAGLTQRELAKLVGTTASTICRLEDADYEGHSMTMLRRVAQAVGKRVEVRFVPAA